MTAYFWKGTYTHAKKNLQTFEKSPSSTWKQPYKRMKDTCLVHARALHRKHGIERQNTMTAYFWKETYKHAEKALQKNKILQTRKKSPTNMWTKSYKLCGKKSTNVWKGTCVVHERVLRHKHGVKRQNTTTAYVWKDIYTRAEKALQKRARALIKVTEPCTHVKKPYKQVKKAPQISTRAHEHVTEPCTHVIRHLRSTRAGAASQTRGRASAECSRSPRCTLAQIAPAHFIISLMNNWLLLRFSYH